MVEQPYASLKTKQNYYPALTGIRAVAAYLVVFYHLNPFIQSGPTSKLGAGLNMLMQQGYVGVSAFFVLSGFLITNRYAENLTINASWMRRYLQNRFARIYPIFFLLSAVSFIILQYVPLAAPNGWSAYFWKDKLAVLFLNFTLLRAFFKDLASTGLPTAWSLTIEEAFYLLAPFMLVALAGKWKRLVFYPLLLIGTGLALVALGKYLPYGFFATVRYMFVFTFFGRCIEFLIGMALSLWLSRSNNGKQTSGNLVTWLSVACFGLCVVLLAIISRYLPSLDVSKLSFGLVFGVGMIILPTVVAALFFGLITEDTWLRRVLSSKVFEVLGKSSYVLYLLHLGPLNDLFSQYVTSDSWVRTIVYTMVSICLYELVEHPLHSRLRAKTSRA
jgi:peptidoglycan/LPS O-acetylase OafA/YrhL